MIILKKADILSEIEAAFGRNPPPAEIVKNHDSIWKNREPNDRSEKLDVIRLFMNRPWWEVNSTYAYEGRAHGDIEMAYTYLTPEAFAYYTPSLLILAIDQIEVAPEKRVVAWIGELDFHLNGIPTRQLFEERISCFTPEQKRAVFHALEFIAQGYGEGSIKPEIIAYWSQFA